MKTHIKVKVKNVTVSDSKRKTCLDKVVAGEVILADTAQIFLDYQLKPKKDRDYSVFKDKSAGSSLHP